MPTDEFLPGAAALCRKYGTLLIADEIQTGMGRTGRFLAVEHWNVEPDMVLLAKALSGGHVPVGALLTRKSIFDKIFNSDGPRGRARIDVCEKRSGDGRRHRDAGSDRIRKD